MIGPGLGARPGGKLRSPWEENFRGQAWPIASANRAHLHDAGMAEYSHLIPSETRPSQAFRLAGRT